MNHYLLDYSFADPESNLALEEVLIRPMIKGPVPLPILRIWQNDRHCIVLGRAEKSESQVKLSEAQKRDINVIRRISGGGTVVHGPGNINISFFLPYSFHSSLDNLKSSYKTILSWVTQALYESTGAKCSISGTSDLSLGDLKISGTAQARKRYGLLHHLTLLINYDTSLIPHVLHEPEKQPDYRGHRTHEKFVTTLSEQGYKFDKKSFVRSLSQQLGQHETLNLNSRQFDDVKELCSKKYHHHSWNILGQEPPK